MKETDFHCFVGDTFRLPPTGNGALDGVTFVAKDNMDVVAGPDGMPRAASYGCSVWRETHPPTAETAEVVRLVLEAGGTLEGIVTLDMFAASVIGNWSEGKPPINPLYPDRFTGGSSSGTASAVAAELADLGLCTDTNGSARVPAAACGLCAVRPTYDRISTQGVRPLTPFCDTVGLMARDPGLLRRVFNVVARENDTPCLPIERILVPLGDLALDGQEFISPDVFTAVEIAATGLSKVLNIPIERVEMGRLFSPGVRDLLGRLQGRELAKVHGNWIGRNWRRMPEHVGRRLHDLCETYGGISNGALLADNRVRSQYRKMFKRVVPPGTVVVKPIIPRLTPKRKTTAATLERFRQDTFRLTTPASIAGAPEVVVPVRFNKQFTIGVGLMGAPGQDSALLDAAVRWPGRG